MWNAATIVANVIIRTGFDLFAEQIRDAMRNGRAFTGAERASHSQAACNNRTKNAKNKPKNDNGIANNHIAIRVPQGQAAKFKITIDSNKSRQVNANAKYQKSVTNRPNGEFASQNHKTHNKTFKGGAHNHSTNHKTSRNAEATWMYVGRLKLGKEGLQRHLTEHFPGYFFKVESLPLYKDGKLPCFKVLVDNRILPGFQQIHHWPQGVKITKYNENFRH